MSWSRWPSWNGRFSPFSRSTPNAEVKESDYEYVRPEDLQDEPSKSELRHHTSHSPSSPDRHHHQHHHHRPRSPSPERDTDVLVLRHKKNSYPVHFPAHSISSGELRISDIRAQAAKKTGSSTKRIKLFHKGRNLKDDHRLCRDEGLYNASEILCGDASGSSLDDSDSDASGSSVSGGDGDAATADGVADGSGSAEGSSDKPKGRRTRRSRKKKSGAKKSKKPTTTTDGDFLEPHPSNLAPPQPTKTPSRAPSPAGRATPQTPLDKLNALSDALNALLPSARTYLAQPPADPAKCEFEYRRLTETILAQVVLKVDGVETEGDETARARRKELVKEAQGWMDGLDRAFKGGR